MNNKAGAEGPLGFGLIVVGAIAVAIAAFLPFDEPTTPFGRVKDNTLIQSNHGWLLIALVVGTVVMAYRVCFHKPEQWVLPILASLLAGVLLFATASSKDIRTLYPVRNGVIDTSQPGTVADLGIGVFVAGFGIVAAVIGSVILATSARKRAPVPFADEKPAPARPKTKKCPDCAETILADAKVCKHCGYRFASTAAVGADSQVGGTEPTKNVRCYNCNHVQPVPVSQRSWQCDQCNERLRRKMQSD